MCVMRRAGDMMLEAAERRTAAISTFPPGGSGVFVAPRRAAAQEIIRCRLNVCSKAQNQRRKYVLLPSEETDV